MRALAVLVACAGCLKDVTYVCTSNADCESHNQPGFCEADQRCAYLDSSCASGRRYGALARGESKQCVGGSADGGVGSGDGGGTCPANFAALPGVPSQHNFTLDTASDLTTERV